MKISIALTTYNGAAYLQAQLSSYLVQERLPDELIVCDDVSTDETVKILESFKDAAPFKVRIIVNKKNLGYTQNFGKVISKCTGDLIFLSDQDDIWFSEKISVIENIFHKNPDKYLLIHDGELVNENLISFGATKLGQVLAGYGSDDSFITGALTVIRNVLVQDALPIPTEIIGHDRWLHGIASLLERRIVTKECLQQIRRHSTNTSTWIASSVKPINRATVVRNQLLEQPATSYEDRLEFNFELEERLLAIDVVGESDISESRVAIGIEKLTDERQALLQRERLLRLGFFRRKIKALQILVNGSYVHFNGLRSFLRDLFR
jgi:glycosyltransferase involved in cell wall biosynthesis